MSREILSVAQMRRIETEATTAGEMTGLALMRAAAQSVVDAILAAWPQLKAGKTTVLCGPGLNGGDGYLIAGLLADMGGDVSVVQLGDHGALPPDAATARDEWLARGGRIMVPDPLDPPVDGPADLDDSFQELCVAGIDLLIDAMLGTGGRRELPCGWADFLVFAKWHHCRIVAVDGHSGLDLSTGRSLLPRRYTNCAADMTVAFHALKPGHVLAEGPRLSGRVVVGDIGLFNFQRRMEHRPGRLIPLGRTIDGLETGVHKTSGHKYCHGHALVLAGPAGHEAAAMLAATASLRVGAGLVTLGRTREAGTALLRPLAMMQAIIDDEADLARLIADERINSVCLGPGLGIDRAAALLPVLLETIVTSPVQSRLGKYRTVVLDADALTAISRDPERLMPLLGGNCILTPHDGEFARLFPRIAKSLADPARRFSRIDAVKDAALKSGAIILLKGPDTIIAGPSGRVRIHSACDIPWLATAGAGDVLAGIIAGLLARGHAPLDAAASGAWLHAAAARRFGPGLIADDLPDQLPAVFRDLGL